MHTYSSISKLTHVKISSSPAKNEFKLASVSSVAKSCEVYILKMRFLCIYVYDVYIDIIKYIQ